MTGVATAVDRRVARADAAGLIGALAWRNLWRNRRRTALSVGAIAFAVALLSFAIAQQTGNYGIMIDNATGMLTGHLQIQRRGFDDDPRIGAVVHDVSRRVDAVRTIPDVVAATPRISAFVLASAHDRAFGAQLLGVVARDERTVSTLPNMVAEGRYLDDASGASEAFAGALLARNLGAQIGDELVILGLTPTGGVAPLALTLVGTFSSGVADIDRSVVEAPFDAAAAAFELEDSAHAIVVKTRKAADAHAVGAALRRDLGPDEVVLEWPQLVAGLQQAIELDRTFGDILFAVVAAVVTIGVFNAFVMTIFERTREFGTLLALGMRPRALVGTLQLEGLCLAALGCGVGVAIGVPLIVWLQKVGMPMGEAGAAVRQFHMADRFYPALSLGAVLKPSMLMIVGTSLASLLPALRIRSIRPAEVLRAV
jgi:ABC-type lipoprotein release transport system permease subunit